MSLYFLQSYNFTELKAFTPYKLGIMAFNSIGEGPVETIPNQWTEEGGNIQNLIFGLDRIDRLRLRKGDRDVRSCRNLDLGDLKGKFDTCLTFMYVFIRV